jgi:predicted amidophosphoribosyltransferase
MRTDIIKRHRRTRTQTRMSIDEKARNVVGAFLFSAAPESLEGIRHILIVDDVFTTGSTLYACFSALRSVLPPEVRISVATLGFVGRA